MPPTENIPGVVGQACQLAVEGLPWLVPPPEMESDDEEAADQRHLAEYIYDIEEWSEEKEGAEYIYDIEEWSEEKEG
eukprot:1689225-Pyramimonas_sp.AAC.1